MRVFSIADLHLSDGDKPMNVFGSQWENHEERIARGWRETVADDDLVLLPGDHSWAMQLEQAEPHLRWIGTLPGEKVLTRGNHDYWWSAIGRVRSVLPEGMYALQNDARRFGNLLVCGSRGWTLPNADTCDEDRKIYERELLRLEMSCRAARAISEDLPLIAMLHYPPRDRAHDETGFTGILERYRVSHVVYGHLHGDAIRDALIGCRQSIQYHLVSSDSLSFCPKYICTIE